MELPHAQIEPFLTETNHSTIALVISGNQSEQSAAHDSYRQVSFQVHAIVNALDRKHYLAQP